MRIIIGIFFVLLGISALTGLSLFKFFFAAIIIFIGLRIITGRNYRDNFKRQSTASSSSNEDEINEVVIFSGLNKTIKSDNFKGGKAAMVFGGGTINLSQSKSNEKVINLEIVAVFGGAKLIIPREWKVNLKGTSIFGGYNNKTSDNDGDIILNIEGVTIFGGIEIFN